MTKIPFNVDAYTARLIGRENVSKLEGAVIELVKNTYDADASCCVLYYDKRENVLYLADNGCGMTALTIQKHWMTIGRSSKKIHLFQIKDVYRLGKKESVVLLWIELLIDVKCLLGRWTIGQNYCGQLIGIHFRWGKISQR